MKWTTLTLLFLLLFPLLLSINVVHAESDTFIQVNLLCAEDEEFRANPDKRTYFIDALDKANSYTSSSPLTIKVEDSFESTFGLHFEVVGWVTWDSDDDTHDPMLMADEVWTDTGFESQMVYNGKVVDVLCALTGQEITGKYACTFPDANITLIGHYVSGHFACIRHEFSHLFGLPECTNWGVMNEGAIFHTIYPCWDWCDHCTQMLNDNKFKYGVDLSISASSHGTTDPVSGTYTYGYSSSVSVGAYADSGYIFDYWMLDGKVIYNVNPITVTMYSDHDLKARFKYVGGGWGNPGPPPTKL